MTDMSPSAADTLQKIKLVAYERSERARKTVVYVGGVGGIPSVLTGTLGLIPHWLGYGLVCLIVLTVI